MAEPLRAWLSPLLSLSAPPFAVNPQPLLWQQESQLHPGLVLALFMRNLADSLVVKEEPRVLFNQGYGIELAHRWLPIANDSGVVPALLPGSVASAHTLSGALENPPQEAIWIIADSLEQAQAVAALFLPPALGSADAVCGGGDVGTLCFVPAAFIAAIHGVDAVGFYQCRIDGDSGGLAIEFSATATYAAVSAVVGAGLAINDVVETTEKTQYAIAVGLSQSLL